MGLSLKRALVYTTGERYYGLILSFLMLGVSSRLLSPAEFGFMAVAHAVTMFVLILRELASQNYIVQTTIFDEADKRTIFTLQMVMAGVSAAAMAALAAPVARYYGNPVLETYFHIAWAGVIVDSYASNIIGHMRRAMAFDRLALINIAIPTVGAVAFISCALLGLGILSAAISWVVASLAGALIAASLGWKYRTRGLSLARWREVSRFGLLYGTDFLLNRLYDQLPYLVFGRLMDAASVGRFNRSISLTSLPDKVVLGGLASVLLPSFTARARDGGDVRALYLRALAVITVFHWPALLLLGLLATPVVRVMLGEQWLGIADYVRILAIAAMWNSSGELFFPVLAARNAIRDNWLRALIVWPASSAILIGAALLGGLNWVVAAFLVVAPLQAFVGLSFLCRRLDMTPGMVGAALRPSAVAAIAALILPLLLAWHSNWRLDFSFAEAVVIGLSALPGWLMAVMLQRHPVLESAGLAHRLPFGLRRAA